MSQKHTGYREVVYIGPPEPKPSNWLGFFGFLVTIMSCGMLAPLGALMSLFAMRKRPRGFATVGLILGLAGTAGMGLTAYTAKVEMDQKHVRRAQAQTNVQMNEARALIENHVAMNDKIPEGTDGNILVLHIVDAWDTELRYDHDEENETYQIRSAGPDRNWDTRDDMVMGRNANHHVAHHDGNRDDGRERRHGRRPKHNHANGEKHDHSRGYHVAK